MNQVKRLSAEGLECRGHLERFDSFFECFEGKRALFNVFVQKLFNPEFAVAIYCGLKILAATLVYCFYHPVLLTGPQRETIGTYVPLLFHPPDETKLPVARVVVCDTILLLNIIMIMPASQNRSNYAFHCGFLRLVTKPTAKSGFN
jgi:hypothetical protein